MELIKKEITYKGKQEFVYFRELTGGDQLQIVDGQKYRGKPKDGEIEIDISSNLKAAHKRLHLTLVDENNVRIYPDVKAVAAESGKRLKVLLKAADEVHKDDDEPTEAQSVGND